MTRQTDITKCRMEFLKQFDCYVRNIIGDEEITATWLECGLPDGWSDDDLKEIALDDELWIGCVQCFGNCCEWAGVI